MVKGTRTELDMLLSRIRTAYKDVRRAYRQLEKDGSLRPGSALYRSFYCLMDEFRAEEKRLAWQINNVSQLVLFEEKKEEPPGDGSSLGGSGSD